MLAVANQLDKVLKKCDKPRINLDMLTSGKKPKVNIEEPNSQEGVIEDEVLLKTRQEDMMN